MRIKRSKKYHKFVNFYRVVYKFVPPFKVLLDGNFIFTVTKHSIDLKPQLQKVLQDQPLLVMTKCLMRELESQSKTNSSPFLQQTLAACKNIVKLPCKHAGGILAPDECIKNYVGARNEHKVFVATQDEDLKNYLRNEVGTVPLFFFKDTVLIMDSPSDMTKTKFQIKEQLKLEPTKSEKKWFKTEREEMDKFIKEERLEEKSKKQKATKDLLCMGMVRKLAAGPNPLSVRKKVIKKAPKVHKRRLRKGKRSRELSALKRA